MRFGRLATVAFAIALLYPLVGVFAPIGAWRWDNAVMEPTVASVRVSLTLTAVAMIVVVTVGTPIAYYIARSSLKERIAWQAVVLLSVLLPSLALGLLLVLAFGRMMPLGQWLARIGLDTSNSPTSLVGSEVYVSIGYYVLGAIAAFEAVPRALERHAELLGQSAFGVFKRVTLPLASTGLGVALSLAWVRALGEFGAVLVTSYYPAGMPVQLWSNLQTYGLAGVMPLLVVFILSALPLPWLVHVFAQRRHEYA